MKKSKLAIGLMTALLSVGTLSACSDVSYSPEGVILTYTGEDGTTISYTAADLFSDEFKDSSNYQVVFDAVYKLIIKNYFTEADPDEAEYGKKQLASLKTKAQVAVDGDKQTASKKAESNGTSYDTEFSAILKEKNCENEKELFDYYLYQYEEETFNDNFEKIDKNMKIMKNGTSAEDIAAGNPSWDGYFKDKVPYHVSHILVKIEDASSTNYANATVSEANAKKLFTVADALRQNTYNSFADTATLSDDSATRGDLGLVDMDKTATYIDEFKFALYAYENIYGQTEGAQDSKIALKGELLEKYKENAYLHGRTDEEGHDGDKTSIEGFAKIPYGAFEIMQSNAERELGANDQKVNDGDKDFYPRNIFFNHYFNRHSLALVSPEKAKKTIIDSEYYDDVNFDDSYEENLKTGMTGTGFHNFTKEGDGVNFEGTYLATSIALGDKIVYRPILVVRGGSSGDSGYQGIHFIVINRSPFEYIDGDASDTSVASLSNYYTTYFPSQDRYPIYSKDGVINKYQTYVNFSGNKDTYQSRADEVKSAIKGYDADGLKHFMFKKYLNAGKLTFKDENIFDGLTKWMDRSEQNKEYNATVEWENKWISYIENLKQAVNIQKQKTISKTCAIRFSNHSGTGSDLTNPENAAAWNEIGGICNDGTRHY